VDNCFLPASKELKSLSDGLLVNIWKEREMSTAQKTRFLVLLIRGHLGWCLGRLYLAN
jgi:hypothetical protein